MFVELLSGKPHVTAISLLNIGVVYWMLKLKFFYLTMYVLNFISSLTCYD